MAVTYSTTAINARLNAVVTTIGSSGFIVLRESGVDLVAITMANPCGTVSSGVLSFTGPLQEDAIASGSANQCVITTSGGTTVISGLTVGIPLSGADVIISNGLNSTVITLGQDVAVLSATITGS